MKIKILSINSAKTFERNLFGVSKYTRANLRLFSEIGEAELYVYSPPIFYAKGRKEESYFRLNMAGKVYELRKGERIIYLSLSQFMRFLRGYLKYKEFYSPFYYLDLEIPEGDVTVFEFFPFIRHLLAFKGPKIYRPHEVYAIYRKENLEVIKQEKEALERSDLILPPSRMDVEKFCEIYGVNEEKFEPVPLPYLPSREPPRREYPDRENLNIIFSGFPHTENLKALKHLLEMAEEVENAIFHVYGPFEGRDTKNVIFHGFVPREEYERALLKADLAIIPTEQETGINVRVSEYVSFGLPILGTKNAFRGYEMVPWEHYIPIELGSSGSLEKALGRARIGKVRKEIANKALEHFKKDLSVENLSVRILRILQDKDLLPKR